MTSRRATPLAWLLPAMVSLLGIHSSRAGSATWKTSPATADWNLAANWVPATVPNGLLDTATFDFSNKTNVSLSANTEVNGVTFDASASAFSITARPFVVLTISGTGVTNNSGIEQKFVAAADGTGQRGVIKFTNNATAGNGTSFSSNGSAAGNTGTPGGSTEFYNSSSADKGTYTTNGGSVSGANGGFTSFDDNSTASGGTFTTNASPVAGAGGGLMVFGEAATAANGTFITKGAATVSAGAGSILFAGSATAGNATFIVEGSGASNGQQARMKFFGTSTAGNATFTNKGAAFNNGLGGFTEFIDNSTAGLGFFTVEGGQVTGAFGGFVSFVHSSAADATFIIEGAAMNGARGGEVSLINGATADTATMVANGGAVSGASGGIIFYAAGSAGNATLRANGGAVSGASGGSIEFSQGSSANNATLIAIGSEGGQIIFDGSSTGDTARVEVFGNGTLDIRTQKPPGVTIGSLEGDGHVVLGARSLTVGSNNLDTRFSGVIADREGLSRAHGGSLNKIGTGKLVLRHRNTYTGGTIINEGKLVVNNEGGSATGKGPVQVNGGRLGGKGVIAGAVTVGAGSGPGAILSPGYLHGAGSPGALTIENALAFNSDATYEVEVNSNSAIADEVAAHGVTINTGAQFSFADQGNSALPAGTVFRVINNLGGAPITGTFGNLPDGSTFPSNGNTYKVNYEGGTGNDLTLTVD